MHYLTLSTSNVGNGYLHPIKLALLLTVLAVGVCAMPDVARACFCAAPSFERHTVPDEGTESCPVDRIIRIFLKGGYPERPGWVWAREYRLTGPDGDHIERSGEVVRNRVEIAEVEISSEDTERLRYDLKTDPLEANGLRRPQFDVIVSPGGTMGDDATL